MVDQLLDSDFLESDALNFRQQVDFDFEPYLPKEEKLVWVGQPKKGITLHSPDWVLIPLGLAFLAFSIYWLVISFSGSLWLVFGIGFVPLFLGLYFLVGRFLYAGYRKARTYYAMTEKRLIWVTQYKQKKHWTVELNDITEVEIKLRSSNYGSLLFNETSFDIVDAIGLSILDLDQAEEYYFEMIPEVEKVAALIRIYQQDS